MAKSRNQRRLERLIAVGGKASMAALVALPVACGDVNSPDELASRGPVKASRRADPVEEQFARIDADLPFANDAAGTLALSAGYCKDESTPSAADGKCTINGKTSASLEKAKYLNIQVGSVGEGKVAAPVKISTRASDGALLVNGFEAVVLEKSGWSYKTYKYKSATTNVVIVGTNTVVDPAITGQQELVIVDLSSRAGPKTVTYTGLVSEGGADDLTKSDVLYVKGSAGADTASALADGTVKVGGTIFRTSAARPASLHLMLGGGDDVYDGSKFVGYATYSAAGVGSDLKYGVPPVRIYGQDGNDTFYSGAAIEWFVGGADTDTVRSLGFTKNGDIYATSGGLDVNGAQVSGGTGASSQFMDDSVATTKLEEAAGYIAVAGHPGLPFYDTLRADVLDLSGWIGATTRFHGASGENGCEEGKRFDGLSCADVTGALPSTLFGGNDWLVNTRTYRNSQDIVGLVIDASKTTGDATADASEVSIAAWPPGVHGQAVGAQQTNGAIQMYGLAKLLNETDDSIASTTEEYFSTYYAPRTQVTFTGDPRPELFVQSSAAFSDNLKGSAADAPAKDTISYELRTRPVKVDFTYYGKSDGTTSIWADGTYGEAWYDGNHLVPVQPAAETVLNAKPVHGEGYYVGGQQKRVFVVTEADGIDGFANAIGGAGADWLVGSQGPNFLSGGPGADMIEGMGGSDLVAGGPGADLLDGGSAYAADGTDLDVLDYSGAFSAVKVDLSNSQQDNCVERKKNETTGDMECNTGFVATLSGLNDADLAAYLPKDAADGTDPVNMQTAIDSKKTVGDGDYVWRFEGVKGSAFGDTLTAAVSALGAQEKSVGSILAGGPGNDFLYGVVNTADKEYPDLLLGGPGDDYIGFVEPVDAVDGGEGDDLVDAADTESGATLNATTWPDATTSWDDKQPTANLTDLYLLPSYVGADAAFPRMTTYVSSTADGVPTYTEYTFTCGAGSDIVSWSLNNTYDATATGPKDLKSCNEAFSAATGN